MRHHLTIFLLLLSMVVFRNIDSYAQVETQNTDKVYDVSIVSKGQGSILCNEEYLVDYDERKEFTLKNNADVRLSLSPKDGYKLSKFTINGISRIQDVENNRLTLKGISRKTVIVATFENGDPIDDSVKMTIVSSSGGTLHYNGESIVDTKKTFYCKKGSTIRLECDPQEGFELEKLSVNGILRDVSNNVYSFEIQRNSIVKATFSVSPSANPSNSFPNPNNSVEGKPKFVLKVSGPGNTTFSGEINGVVAGDPKDPLRYNKEEFYVTNGSDVTLKLDPIRNIKSFIVKGKDLTQTIKSSNGVYTVGVLHDDPKNDETRAIVEFTQRYVVEIICNEYGSYTTPYFYKKTEIPNCFIIDKGKGGIINFVAKLHCHLEKLIVNGIDVTNKVFSSNTITTGSGPAYGFDISIVEKDYKIVATFAPDPKLTIVCGQNGSVDRAENIADPIKSIYYADPEYTINPGEAATFYEPSAAKGSMFYGKPWILRTIAREGYELAKLTINNSDVTSSVKRYPPSSPRNNQEMCFISLGFIKKDTRVEIMFKKKAQPVQQPQVEWVDLGTGVKWATRNVGAKNASDAGNYYTWKEANDLHVQKGRLPTHEEIQRLKKECHPKYDQENGVNGYRFYHKSDKSISIFIPAAGYYPQYDEPNKLIKKSEEGAIWSSDQTEMGNKVNEAMKEHTMDPIWLLIGDAFSSEGYDRSALAFSVKEKITKILDADIGVRMSVRLVLDK